MAITVLEALRIPQSWSNDAKQLSLNNVLAELVESPLELGDVTVENAFVSFFDALYSEGFRHRYSEVFGLFGGFCGRDSGIGPAQRAKTTIWN